MRQADGSSDGEKREWSGEGESNCLRAFQEIVKLNQNALSPSCISDGQVDIILSCLLSVMTQLLAQQKSLSRSRKLRPAVWALLFLLKRRRYNRSFLAVDVEDTNDEDEAQVLMLLNDEDNNDDGDQE